SRPPTTVSEQRAGAPDRPDRPPAHPRRPAYGPIRGGGVMSAQPTVAPAEFPDVFILPSGTTLVLRVVQCGDRDRIHELVQRLGDESRYRRFLTPKHELSERELAYLSDIDHVS